MSDAEPKIHGHAPALREALANAYAKRYPDARAIYLWILARRPNDPEALTGLAHVDAWDGCWELAEQEFVAVLGPHPEHTDARAGLVDLYMWQKRWRDARSLLDAGLARDPDSVDLRMRQARLLHWTGDEWLALGIMREIERRDPRNAEASALRDEIFVGQAALELRMDAYPGGYPNIYTLDAQLMQRWRRFEFTVDSHLVDWSGGDLIQPIVDGERSLRVAYHLGPEIRVGVEAGFGNPGVVLPAAEFGADVGFPIYARFSGALDYWYWTFSGDVSVHIINPTIAYEVNDDVEVAAHAWFVHVGIGPSEGGLADTWGGHVGWKVTSRLRTTLYYTYGVELDRDPNFTELFTLRSHFITAAADWMVDRDWGLRALLAFEYRTQENVPPISIGSVGAGLYARW